MELGSLNGFGPRFPGWQRNRNLEPPSALLLGNVADIEKVVAHSTKKFVLAFSNHERPGRAQAEQPRVRQRDRRCVFCASWSVRVYVCVYVLLERGALDS